MSTTRSVTGHLRLVVHTADTEPQSSPLPKETNGGQGLLFPSASRDLLLLVDMSSISDDCLIDLISNVKPRWIFDLRALPRFDIGSLNRHGFFDLCRVNLARYRDIGGLVGIAASRDASLSSGVAAVAISEMLNEVASPKTVGPIAVLLGSMNDVSMAAIRLPSDLRPKPKGGWKVCSFVQRPP